VAAASGLMHPHNLTGSGNLFLLLTKRGGHVGWPTGWLPQRDGWKWMSDISMSFVAAVAKIQAKDRQDAKSESLE
jgi:predicted alpha/beta-fold hydrolase